MSKSPQQVYFVGLRYPHHSSHSGYEGFGRYTGASLRPPMKVRFMSSHLGWRVDTAVTSLTSRPYYSLGLLLAESAAALHMVGHRRALYHVLYGDTDLWLLGHASRVMGNPVVATFHEPSENLEFMRVDKALVRDLAGVVLLSEDQRSYFAKLLPSERIFVVPHGIDTEFFCPAAAPGDQEVCVTVGSHLRDFDTLAQAMKRVWQVRPNARLVAVGTRRPKDSNPRFNFEDGRIQFLDGIGTEELLATYQGARVGVFSLRGATANNALLEAAACGLPSVSTDVGAVREYLGHEAGIFCPPRDPEAMAAGILRLLGDPDLAGRMGLAGRRRVLQYDYKRIADQLREVYSSVSRRGRNGSKNGSGGGR